MSRQRKTILVVDPSSPDPAAVRRLLAGLGYIAINADGPHAALRALGTMRFDIVVTSTGQAQAEGGQSFVQDVRALAPGTAVVGLAGQGGAAANDAWLGECDATIRLPLSPSRVQWALEFELRYFGS